MSIEHPNTDVAHRERQRSLRSWLFTPATRPERFQKAAEIALGVEFPSSILVRADEVIE